MSLGHGAITSRSGLIFYYDMHNTIKSWKGKPTTNMHTGALYGMSNIVCTYVDTIDGWDKYSLSGTWSSGTYPFSMRYAGLSSNFFGDIAYSAKIKIKTNVPQKFATFGSISYVNDPNMVSGGIHKVVTEDDGSKTCMREGFIYSVGYAGANGTNQSGYIGSQPIADGTVFDPATDFVWIKDIQVEEGTFCTPYVSGTRSDTASLLDLAGNRTITMTNITYNIDNTFSFNGVDNRAIMENPQMPQYDWSIEIVTSYNDTSNLPILVNPYSYGVDQYIKYHSDGRVMLALTELADTNNRIHYSTYYASPGENVHYVFIRTPTTVQIYVNGKLNREISDTIISAPWDLTWCIGARHNSTYWYNGDIPILKVYNRVLTSQEVLQNFNAIRGRFGI